MLRTGFHFVVLLTILSLAAADVNLENMYDVLKGVAMPDAKSDLNQRFVLQMPGKVLTYSDYYPGKTYAEAKKNSDNNKGHVAEIPPVVMEKMFQLSDAVPGLHTLHGGDTGDSFAEQYTQMLGRLDVWEFGKKEDNAIEEYNKAVQFLSEPISDPDNLEAKVSWERYITYVCSKLHKLHKNLVHQFVLE